MESHTEPEVASSQTLRARRFPRVPFHAPVRVTRLSTGQALEFMAQNLSASGMFVETVIPIPVGEFFRVAFPTSPGGFDEVAVARVAWRRPFTSSRPAGMSPGIGFAFLLMRPAERRALEALVEDGGVPPVEQPRKPPNRGPSPPPTRDMPLLIGNSLGEDVIDLGPTGWLLLAALSMAAVAALLAGLHPLP